jgi:hypothetical protein
VGCLGPPIVPAPLREIFWHEITWERIFGGFGKTRPNSAAWIFSRSSLFQTAVPACGRLAARKEVVTGYFFEGSGGNFLNIFTTPLSRLSMFFSDLSESVSLAEPRQTSFFVAGSDRSTTRVPTR